MAGLTAIQLVIGVALITLGLARRQTFGVGLVIVGAAVTWSAAWSGVGGGFLLFRLSAVSAAIIGGLAFEVRHHPERLRAMQTELVLSIVAVLALVSSELFVPPRSEMQSIVIGAVLVSYVGILISFVLRMTIRFLHAPPRR